MAIKYRLVAGMATIPTRSHTAPKAIQSLVGQFDKFYLILNGFQEVPKWANIPGVTAILPENNRDYGAAGKLLGLSLEGDIDNTIYYCVDDDIIYPKNFAHRLAVFLREKKCIIGVRGSVMLPDFKSWRTDRENYNVIKRLLMKKKVDVIATCGCAFFSSALSIDPENWPEKYKNCVDLFLAKLAHSQGLERWIISRRKRWLQPIESSQEDSISSELLRDESKHVELALELIAMKEK